MNEAPLVSPGVRAGLRRLGRALRVQLVVTGLAWVLVAVVGATLLSLLCDWGLHRLTRQSAPATQRALVSLVALAGVGYVAWRQLGRRAFVRPDELDLALLVERHYPQLADRLAGAVAFARRGGDRSASPALVAAMARQANFLAAGIDYLVPLDRRRFARHAMMGLAAGGLLATLALAAPNTMGLWFGRNVLLSAQPWPRDTYLLVEGGPDFEVVRGGDLSVRVVADPARSRHVPPAVRFLLRYPSVGAVEQSAPWQAGGYSLTFTDVTEPFSFRVTGGDGQAGPFQVRLVEPAELSGVAFTVEYPAYTQLPTRRFDGAHGGLSIPPGSSVRVQAVATKPLASAEMWLDDAPLGEVRLAPVRLGAMDAAAPGVQGRFQVPLEPAGVARTLRLGLTDAEGFANPSAGRYRIHVRPDAPPELEVRWLALTRNLTARATVPLEVEARDDYGLASLAVEAVSAEGAEPTALPLSGPAGRELALPATIDLEPLGLAEGTTLRLAVLAEDTCPPTQAGPNRRRSGAREFRIVSEAELLAELLKQQKELRLRMEQTLAAQAQARDALRGADDARAAGQAAETQRLVRESLRAQQNARAFSSSIVAAYRDILTILAHNRAGTPEQRTRLQTRVLEPLAQLEAEAMAQTLSALHGLGESPGESDLAPLVARQQDHTARLEAILAEMARVESIQELAQSLKLVLDSARQIQARIDQRLQSQTLELFDEPPAPPEVNP